MEGSDSYRALCPAHPDTDQSLSVSVGERARIIWHCFAGCEPLAVRAGLIADGASTGCLPLPREVAEELVDQLTALYGGEMGHAELRWRIYSLLRGFGGELPPKRGYPGGRRGFAREAGVSPADAYGLRGHDR